MLEHGDDQTVYRVRTIFPGSNSKTHDLVRATSQQRAKWWASDQYDRGFVEWAMPIDPTGIDGEIVDVGGWDEPVTQ